MQQDSGQKNLAGENLLEGSRQTTLVVLIENMQQDSELTTIA